MAGSRYLELRWPGTCGSCAAPLAPGTRAWWNAERKSTTCIGCRPVERAPTDRTQGSRAGASAQREYERRKANDERRVRKLHPHTGGLRLKLRGEPQHLTAWAKGAEGERLLGAALDVLASESVRVLHDRRVPGGPGNIDHVVVTPGAVYVVDAKRHRNKKVEKREKGGLFRTDTRLYVGGRDGTGMLDGMARQVEAVHHAVGAGPPVHPVLCFIDAEWGLFAKPFVIRGVLVCPPKAFYKRVKADGRGGCAHVADLAERLASKLPPA
ncbi:MAG: hypothetical protein JWL73_244 [Actinomycetia bacterium]|nr:hypothetical protein [Actinomycetes bacterium]